MQMPVLLQRWLLSLVFACTLPARAQSSSDADRGNAAYWYNRAMQQLDDAQGRMSDADWDSYYLYTSGRVATPSPGALAYVSQLAKVTQLVERGSSQDYSSFDPGGISPLGIENMASIRNLFKSVAEYAAVDPGGADRTTADLAALTQMSGHIAGEGRAMASFVGMGAWQLADRMMRDGFESGQFNEAHALQLLKAHNAFDDNDPFGMADAMMMEQELFVGWLDDQLAAGGELSSADMPSMVGWLSQEQMTTLAEQIDSGSITGESVDALDSVMTSVSEAFAMDDPDAARAKITEIEQQLAAGEHAAMAATLLQGLGRAYEAIQKAQTLLENRKTMLEEVITGKLDLAERVNAATLYLQAIERYRAIADDLRKLIETDGLHGDDVEPVIGDVERITAARKALAEVFDIMRPASRLAFCDFEAIHRERRLQLCPDYVYGLHELFRAIMAEANAADAAGDADTLVDRLQLLLRLTGQLCNDGPVLRPVIVHHWFEKAVHLLENNLAEDGLSEQQRADVHAALRTISRGDPLGYAAALMFSRTRFGMFETLQDIGTTPAHQRWSAAAKQRRDWSGEQLLTFLGMQHLLQVAGHPNGGLAPGEAIALTDTRLEDLFTTILDEDAWTSLMTLRIVMQPMIEQVRLPEIPAWGEVPVLAGFTEQQTEVRAQLRDAQRSVLPVRDEGDGGSARGRETHVIRQDPKDFVRRLLWDEFARQAEGRSPSDRSR